MTERDKVRVAHGLLPIDVPRRPLTAEEIEGLSELSLEIMRRGYTPRIEYGLLVWERNGE